MADAGEKAWEVFSVLREKSAVWNQVVLSGKREKSESVEEGELAEEKASNDLKILATLVRVLFSSGRKQEVELLREQMAAAEIEPDAYFYNALLDMYANQRLVGDISKVLIQMEELGMKPENFIYEKAIFAYLREENLEPDRPAQIFKDITSEVVSVGEAVYKNLIKAFWRLGDADSADQVFEAMLLKGYTPDLKLTMKVMQLHGRKGNYKRNLELLATLKKLDIEPNGSIYDYLLHSYCKAGLIEEARDTFMKYKSVLGTRPSLIAFNMMIDACGKQGLHEEALQFFLDLCKSGLKPNTASYNCIISAMTKVERYEKADQLYRRMLKQTAQPSLHTYLTMIHCYTKCNWTRNGHRVYLALRKAQIEMTDVAYRTVLALYVEGNWYGHAASILKNIEALGMDLDASSHGLLIRSFGIFEDRTTPLTLAVQESKFEVCKLLTSLFLNPRSPKIDAEHLEMVRSFLKKWNEMDDLEAKASIYNGFLDCFWKKGLRGTARTILRMAREVYAGYTCPQLNEKEWVLDVRGLSVGGAKVALVEWLGDVGEMDNKSRVEELMMVIVTDGGVSSPRAVQDKSSETQTKGAKGELLSMLGELALPFLESPEDSKKLQASAGDVLKWISQNVDKQALSLEDCC